MFSVLLHELGIAYSGHVPLFSTIAGIEKGNLYVLPATLRSMLISKALKGRTAESQSGKDEPP